MSESFDCACFSAQLFAAGFAVNHGIIKAFLFAGGFNLVFCYRFTFLMSEGFDCTCFSAQLFTTGCTVNHGIIGTFLFAGGFRYVFNNYLAFLMSESFDCACFSAQLFAAGFAVNHGIIGTFLFAGGFNLVFRYRFTFAVTQSRNIDCFPHKLISTNGTICNGIIRTCLFAGSFKFVFDNNLTRDMRRGDYYLFFGLAAGSAALSFFNARLGAGRFFDYFPFSPFVTESRNYICCSAQLFAADCAVNHGIIRTFLFAGGFDFVFGYRFAFAVTGSVITSFFKITAASAVMAFGSVFHTGRINKDIPIVESMLIIFLVRGAGNPFNRGVTVPFSVGYFPCGSVIGIIDRIIIFIKSHIGNFRSIAEEIEIIDFMGKSSVGYIFNARRNNDRIIKISACRKCLVSDGFQSFSKAKFSVESAAPVKYVTIYGSYAVRNYNISGKTETS